MGRHVGGFRRWGAVAVVLGLSVGAARVWAGGAPDGPAEKRLTFDDKGVKVGEELPVVGLRTMDNEPENLWRVTSQRPTVLVTSSFTCPMSRKQYPAVAGLAEKYKGKIDFVILYVIEAHPIESASPYRNGREDVTEENRRDGVLRKQPGTIEKRLELAAAFKERLGVKLPMYVDRMDNMGWKSVGAGPNMAVLVEDGVVKFRQGWFEEKGLEAELEKVAAQPRKMDYEQSAQDKALSAQMEKDGVSQIDISNLIVLGHLPAIKALLEKYPGLVNFVSQYSGRGRIDGQSLLQGAADQNEAEIVKLLLDRGADPLGPTGKQPSALRLAAAGGHEEVVGLLLSKIPDIHAPAAQGTAALQDAVFAQHARAAAALRKAGVGESIFTRVARGDLEELKRAIESDASAAWRPDGSSRTPLMYAAAANQIEAAKMLVAAGAPVGLPEGAMGNWPLMTAVERRWVAAAEYLISAGAPVDGDGTSLHSAAGAGDMAMVKLLLAHKANVKARDGRAWTPLHAAALAGHTDVAALLLEAGSDVNAVTGEYMIPCGPGVQNEAETPLTLAAGEARAATVKLLLAKGANVQAVTASGQTALHKAAKAERENGIGVPAETAKVIETLLAAGVPVNAEDQEGKTALDDAKGRREGEALVKLIEAAGGKAGSGKKKVDRRQETEDRK